jgi:iron complex transport system ATP-binding protein
MSELAAADVLVKRGGRAILCDVSLKAGAGEFVALIGANGAGKSALLAALAGLLKPDSGVIKLDGRPLGNVPRLDLARRRAYLPQNPRCEWPISVERLVALGLTPTLPAFGGLPPSHLARIDRALEACDLVDRREQPATTLSGGELARAMLARALVGDPEILIADEPITGLDPRHALDTVRRLQELAQGGKLVIAAIHDLTLAARHATRLVALNRGRIAADGAPKDVLTSDLVRSIFEVEAHIAGGNGGTLVDYLEPVRNGDASNWNEQPTAPTFQRKLP